MRGKKITEFPDFVGRKLLLLAQKRGVEITGGSFDGTTTALIGLARILAENNIGGINDIVDRSDGDSQK